MGRSASFFQQVEDLTLLAMLVDRIVAVADNKIDVEELLEKAEIRFVEIVGYEASHSQQRLQHIMTSMLEDPEHLTFTLSQIVRAFALHNSGGPIFKCIDAYLLG